MAVYWNLGLVAATVSETEACERFFREQRLSHEGQVLALEVSGQAHADGWLIGVTPVGMNWNGFPRADPRLTTPEARNAIAAVFDGWLLTSPPFTAAVFCAEAHDLLQDPLTSALSAEGLSGLFVNEALWVTLGRPTSAHRVARARYAWPRTRQA